MRIGIVDLDKCRVITTGGNVLLGQCRRCGKCCGDCEDLMKDPGADRMTCRRYRERPMRCALYPLPENPVQEGCGFRWEKAP